ncbi:MAG: hypothetical protein AAFV49_19365 [Pseudomonadota bacterium]
MRDNAARVSEHESVFAAAEARFGAIVCELGSAERQHMEMSDLEKLLQRQGSELLRELLQGHMDLRSLGRVEEPVIGADGVEQSSAPTVSSVGMSIGGGVRSRRCSGLLK